MLHSTNLHKWSFFCCCTMLSKSNYRCSFQRISKKASLSKSPLKHARTSLIPISSLDLNFFRVFRRWKEVFIAFSKNENESLESSIENLPRIIHQEVVPDAAKNPIPILVETKVVQPSIGTWISTVVIVLVVTVGAVSSALTAFLLYMRPALKVCIQR